jgi:hypothetical protein
MGDEQATELADAMDQFAMALAEYKEAGGTSIGLIDELWAIVDRKVQGASIANEPDQAPAGD